MVEEIKKGRGKSYEEIDYCFAEMSYWDLEKLTGLTSPAHISRLLIPKEFREKDAAGKTNYKCNLLSRVRAGKRVPPGWLAELIRSKINGASYWLEHPIRYLGRLDKELDLDTIYTYTKRIRMDVFKLIFVSNPNKNQLPFRQNKNSEFIYNLNQISNLDALTACFGLLREADSFNFDESYHNISKVTAQIFLRNVHLFPISQVAPRLFRYLRDNTFNTNIEPPWTDSLRQINIYERMDYNRHVIEFIQKFRLIVNNKSPPQICIFLAEKCFSIDQLKVLWELYLEGETERIYNNSNFRIFSSHLRIWEAHKKSNTPYATQTNQVNLTI